jgi:hypothetical protein
MNTQDKIELIQEQVIHHFDKVGCTVDEVCAMVAGVYTGEGIAFSEILPLVKTIGKDNGFIVELADRKARLKLDMADLHFSKQTYSQMTELTTFLADDRGVPEKFVLIEVKAWLKYYGFPIPTKPQLTGWKLSALECWQKHEHVTPELQTVRTWLRQADHNTGLYTQAYHELFTALVTLKEEVK